MIISILQELSKAKNVLHLTAKDRDMIAGVNPGDCESFPLVSKDWGKPLLRKIRQLCQTHAPNAAHQATLLTDANDKNYAGLPAPWKELLLENQYQQLAAARKLQSETERFVRLDSLEQLLKTRRAHTLTPRQQLYFSGLLHEGWRQRMQPCLVKLRLRHAVLLYEQQYLKNEISNLK